MRNNYVSFLYLGKYKVDISGDGSVIVYGAKGYPLSQWVDNLGYLRVKLDGKSLKVHQIACLFNGNPRPGDVVSHKDHNKLNNHPSNLEWTTQFNNVHHSHNDGRASKLKKPVIAYNDGNFGMWFSCVQEANRAGYSKSAVSRCILGQAKSYKGFIWEAA